MAWLDAGTHDSLLEASNFIEAIQKRQGLYVACIEEIAYRLGYIDREALREIAGEHRNTEYGKYPGRDRRWLRIIPSRPGIW